MRGSMLETLFGSVNKERVLIYLHARGEGYAREIARHFSSSLQPIQQQLDNLERGGLIFSKKTGTVRLYQLSPRYPFKAELEALLDKALSFYEPEQKEALLLDRRRPRARSKPL